MAFNPKIISIASDERRSGLVVAVVMWVVVRPILRGVGWLISILTVIAIIYWVLTF